MDTARAKKLEEGRRKLAALRGKKKSSASCAAKCAVGDAPADFVAFQVEPTQPCKPALHAPDACGSCAPETAKIRQVQHADTSVAVPDVGGADKDGSATTPSSNEKDTNSAKDKGGNSAQDKGAEKCAVSRWLDERNKRMRVVLAAALEMEHVVASASCSQANFDPYMTSGGNSRGAKLHALLRSSHEVVQRLEGSGVEPGTEKEETSFPAVSDVLQHLRAANARAKARELSGSASASGEVAPLGVGGGKDSPKSQNSSQGHPPNEGPEKPSSAAHHGHASISSTGDLASGDLHDDAKDHGEAEALRSDGFEGDASLVENGGLVAPGSIHGGPFGEGSSGQSLLSLWESPLDVRRERAAGGTSDQMSASELRRAAGGGGGAVGDSSRGVFDRGGGALAADPWSDEQGRARKGGQLAGGVGDSGRYAEARGGVAQLDKAAGGLSDEANGVVRELTWENSSLQKRVEVQANALIELSVEKERWVAERAAIQQRERDAQARARLLLEEKIQLKESLQAVIEGLLEENVALKTGGAQQAVRPRAEGRAPPPLAPDEEETETHEHTHGTAAPAERAAPPFEMETQPQQLKRDQAPPAAARPSTAPFLGVALGEPVLVGTGTSSEAATLAQNVQLPEDVRMVDAASAGGEGASEARVSPPASPSRKNLEWSLLLSPDGPAVPGPGASSGNVEQEGGLGDCGDKMAPSAAAPTDASQDAREGDSGIVSVERARGVGGADTAPTLGQAPPGVRSAPPSRPFPPELLAHPGDKDIQIDLRHLTNPPPPAPPSAPVILYVAAGVDSILDTLWGVVSLRPVRSTAARVLGFSRQPEPDADDIWLDPSMRSQDLSPLRQAPPQQRPAVPADQTEPAPAEFVSQVHAFETSSSLLKGYTPEVTPRKQRPPDSRGDETRDASDDTPMVLSERETEDLATGAGRWMRGLLQLWV